MSKPRHCASMPLRLIPQVIHVVIEALLISGPRRPTLICTLGDMVIL